MTIIVSVDTNEQATNPKIVKALKRFFPKLKVRQLEHGDLNIILPDGEILSIERKSAHDFLASIGDGRLFNQVERMSNGAKWCAVVVHGVIEYNEHDMVIVNGEETNWKGVSVRGAIMTVQWAGCPITFTRTSEGYGAIVVDMMNLCMKPDKHYQRLSRKRVITFPPVTLAEDIISAFPGIGFKKARSLMNFVKDMAKDTNATLAQALCWISILPQLGYKSRPEGWGDKIVESARTVLGLSVSEILMIEERKKGKRK